MPELVLEIAVGWVTLLLVAGSWPLLRAPDTLHRVPALDVLLALLVISPTCGTSRTTSTRRSRSRCSRSPPEEPR